MRIVTRFAEHERDAATGYWCGRDIGAHEAVIWLWLTIVDLSSEGPMSESRRGAHQEGLGDPRLFESLHIRAFDDLRKMNFPLLGRVGFIVWEILFTTVGALIPDEPLIIRAGYAVGGVLLGVIALYLVLLPVAVWRQRSEARALLRLLRDDTEYSKVFFA